jgi:hypothetical protein
MSGKKDNLKQDIDALNKEKQKKNQKIEGLNIIFSNFGGSF